MALKRIFRLSKRKDIDKVLQSPRIVEGRSIRLFFRENNLPGSRFAFLISKKVSPSAVKRNHLRRFASEWVRKSIVSIAGGKDFLVFFKKGAAQLSRADLYKELKYVFLKINS